MNLARHRSSLARVLEPEVMDSAEEARDYDAMDHREVNRRFALDFLAALAAAGLADDAEVLDLGTGTAQIPIELCALHPRVRVLAVDLAEAMLHLAAANVARAGLAGRVRLERLDAKRLPFDDGRFSAVMSNSIVHHIPQPRAALAEALRVLRAPGGLVFIRDLARPFDDAQVRQLVETYAADCNAHQKKLFDDSLRAALSVEEIGALVAELGGEVSRVAATSDRHWTWSAVSK
ncbi:MAG: class I SAM-dependent methyltransferase [Pirellulales bacterium]